MYLISELATLIGVSRTTLLYYEKIGLIQGSRMSNGYRRYSEQDAQRLLLIQQLQAGGLTLKECQACLEAKLNRQVLLDRLSQLDQEIEHKTKARTLLSGLLGERSQKEWHQSLQQVAPDAHFNWLLKQGFTEKEALRLKWLSKDMNEHDVYMNDFMTVFETLERWGPGDECETRKAFSLIPSKKQAILEIGSGKGLSTLLLSELSSGNITAVDNEPMAINQLSEKVKAHNLQDRIQLVCASMTALPFAAKSFDLIWAEGCAYIMGVENALKQWKPLLQDDGILVVSDLVWLTDSPSEAHKSFWLSEYPDIQTVPTRLEQCQNLGYQVLDHFSISQQSWQNYWQPLQKRVAELLPTMPESQALKDIAKEIDIYENHLGDEFGYEFFVLKLK